jgi:hypothetical protein
MKLGPAAQLANWRSCSDRVRRFLVACNVDGIGQRSKTCISESAIFGSLNLERLPIRIKSNQRREITYV